MSKWYLMSMMLCCFFPFPNMTVGVKTNTLTRPELPVQYISQVIYGSVELVSIFESFK